MKAIRRHTGLMLLCLTAALPLCLSAFFLGGRILIRKAMREKLESSALVVRYVPAGELHWYERGRELLIDGLMFDVKSIRETGGGYEVTGLFDVEETDLFTKLIQHASDRQQGQGLLAGLFQCCLGIISDMPVEGPRAFMAWEADKPHFPKSPPSAILTAHRIPESPPPDVIPLS
jgi:hypothetical protein